MKACDDRWFAFCEITLSGGDTFLSDTLFLLSVIVTFVKSTYIILY